MSPIVRVVHFMGKSLLIIVALLCVAWWAVLIHLFVVYGPLEAIVFAMGSIMLPVIIYGMERHSHHKYDRGRERRYDRR